MQRINARGGASAAPQQQSAGARPGYGRPISAKAVGSFVPRLTRPAFEKYGFSAATLITDWTTIVGAEIAIYTRPERLKWPRRAEVAAGDREEAGSGRPGATLVLAVDPGRALDVQYRTAQIVERINCYFGYRAVGDLRLVQAPVAAAGKPVAAPAWRAAIDGTPADEAALEGAAGKPRQELAGIADQGLRAALERMAAGLQARSRGGVSAR